MRGWGFSLAMLELSEQYGKPSMGKLDNAVLNVEMTYRSSIGSS